MTAPNDLDVLTKLNDDYIQSVQHSNVKRFDEILSDDFLCSNARRHRCSIARRSSSRRPSR